jgi:hypothetical protein
MKKIGVLLAVIVCMTGCGTGPKGPVAKPYTYVATSGR